MHDDRNSNLDELAVSQPTSIVGCLIRAQGCIEQEGRDFVYFNSLRCLQVSSNSTTAGNRYELSVVQLPNYNRDFVAVSHVWESSEREDPAIRQYRVKSMVGTTESAEVSDLVLDRVIRYMISQQVSCFWIDKECIDQSDKREQADAVQAMDVVYRRSRHPVGVLSILLTQQKHVNHLHQLLTGSLSEEGSSVSGRLQLSVSFSKARRVLHTLFRIMCDPWWTRRWIFQEEYCTSVAMRLLLPLRAGLQKPRMFSDIVDNLVVNARTLREQVTRFCIACHNAGVCRFLRSRRQCQFVLQRAKSYGMLRKHGWQIYDLGRNLVMSTRIWADLYRRSASVPSDTLAIMANCCGYATRLSVEALRAAGIRSLSLAMLALFVLNGEIIKHDVIDHADTVLGFVKTHSFQGFAPPTRDQQLTFLKRCRLSSVRLCLQGIRTAGYLWQCSRVVKFSHVAQQGHYRPRAVLDHLIDHLDNSETARLRICFQDYRSGIYPHHLSTHGLQEVFEAMMQNILEAVFHKQSVFIAQLTGNPGISALFVSRQHLRIGATIFTSFEPAETVAVQPRHRFLDKFVSLRVDQNECVDGEVFRLKARDWVNGIWLPDSDCLQQVLFPWPPALCKGRVSPNSQNQKRAMKIHLHGY